jgi:hypothetical protein
MSGDYALEMTLLLEPELDKTSSESSVRSIQIVEHHATVISTRTLFFVEHAEQEEDFWI